MAYPTLTPPTYKPGVPNETGGDAIFNNMVHSYLDLVQPNAFPSAILDTAISVEDDRITFNTTNTDALVTKALKYEVGFLVALAIGLVFIILMTLVGIFFACCRCCGNCGGKMYQKQTSSINCKRRFIYFFLWLITLIILAGNICAFYSNNKITTVVNKGFTTYNDTVSNLQTYIHSVPKEIDFIVDQSDKPISAAFSSIDNIGSTLGENIKKNIETAANPTLESVTNMVNVLNNTANGMTAVNASFYAVKQEQEIIAQNLSDVKRRLDDIQKNCASGCGQLSMLDTTNLILNANFTTLPDFSEQLKKVNSALDTNIEATVTDARKIISDIPETVKNETDKTVTDVRKQLTDIKTKIKEASDISFNDTIKTVEDLVEKANEVINGNRTNIEKYDYYRWIVGICLCCIVLLVVVCNLFGLLLSPCGHRDRADPTERSCLSNSGGNFFMAGAGFSFIFAWLLMLVVAILFVIGGNGYTLICRSWNRNELLPYIDTKVNFSSIIQTPGLNITSLYSKCQKNEAVWQALNLGTRYNLNDYLDISKYTADVNKTLEDTNININHITILDATEKAKVIEVSNAGIENLNFGDVNSQIGKGTAATDLTDFALKLEGIANTTTNDPVKIELNAEVRNLRAIQSSIDNDMLPKIKTLNSSIVSLRAVSATLPRDLNDTVKKAEIAQSYLDSNMSSVIKDEMRKFVDSLISPFSTYVTWAESTITGDLARCRPVASAIESVKITACDYIIDSVNEFWFSLGWCTIFFLPSIILAVKLAKYYRRMKTSDVLSDHVGHMDHLEMKSTSQQFLIPRVIIKQ
uniref:Prominin-like protein n=1 Tax=Leptobrachium leishanense TaxID=445787 RepID=A0A8C5MCN8_9ANUR